eukprot:jgi/Chrzof1/2206/Cz11g06110.t1
MEPSAAIRRDNYRVLHVMAGSSCGRPADIKALTKYLKHDELIDLIQQGPLLKSCISGSNRMCKVAVDGKDAVVKYLLGMHPNAEDIVSKDDCALLLYAVEECTAAGTVMPVMDLFEYLTDSLAKHSFVTQHLDKIQKCLAKIPKDADFKYAPALRLRIQKLLKLMLSICPDKAAHTREVFTKTGINILSGDDEIYMSDDGELYMSCDEESCMSDDDEESV